jgi:hypothetical protein
VTVTERLLLQLHCCWVQGQVAGTALHEGRLVGRSIDAQTKRLLPSVLLLIHSRVPAGRLQVVGWLLPVTAAAADPPPLLESMGPAMGRMGCHSEHELPTGAPTLLPGPAG